MTTVNLHPGWGIANRGRYSNAAVDALTEQADSEFEPSKRDLLLQRAVEVAMNDDAIIPLYFQKNVWGARPGLWLEPRVDEHTQAFAIWEK